MRAPVQPHVAVFALALPALLCADGDLNALSNGSFEQGDVGKPPPAWTSELYPKPAPAGWGPVVAQAGRERGKVGVIECPKGYRWALLNQITSVHYRAGERYRLRVWLRADKRAKVDLCLMPLKSPGALDLLKRWERRRFVVTEQWQPYELDLYTDQFLCGSAAPGGPGLRVIVQLYSSGVKCYVDDASLTSQPIPKRMKAKLMSYARLAEQDAPWPNSPVGRAGGIVLSQDGRLAAFNPAWHVSHSSNGGWTWGQAHELQIPDKAGTLQGVIRMQSGKLGVWNEGWKSPFYFWTSADDGLTWSKRILIGPEGAPFHGNVMIQTRKGRLIMPVRQGYAEAPEIRTGGAFWLLNGQKVQVQTHGHFMEAVMSHCYFSDDEGNTWQKSSGHIMVYKDNGFGGLWMADEPNVVELRDGRIMMFVRTSLGQLYKTYSHDGGRVWQYPQPTGLATCVAPCRLVRMPSDPWTEALGCAGDLLVIWNQESAQEVRDGFARCRLESAVSRDDGETWEHFRTLAAICLPPAGRIEPCEPELVRKTDDLKQMPPDYGRVSYPAVWFYQDTALVFYLKSAKPIDYRVSKLRIIPIKWFYEQ